MRKFMIWWLASTVDQRRELVKRWYDLVYIPGERFPKTSGDVAKMKFLDLPISLVWDLSQDSIFE